jgi:hypothetical protein
MIQIPVLLRRDGRIPSNRDWQPVVLDYRIRRSFRCSFRTLRWCRVWTNQCNVARLMASIVFASTPIVAATLLIL